MYCLEHDIPLILNSEVGILTQEIYDQYPNYSHWTEWHISLYGDITTLNLTEIKYWDGRDITEEEFKTNPVLRQLAMKCTSCVPLSYLKLYHNIYKFNWRKISREKPWDELKQLAVIVNKKLDWLVLTTRRDIPIEEKLNKKFPWSPTKLKEILVNFNGKSHDIRNVYKTVPMSLVFKYHTYTLPDFLGNPTFTCRHAKRLDKGINSNNLSEVLIKLGYKDTLDVNYLIPKILTIEDIKNYSHLNWDPSFVSESFDKRERKKYPGFHWDNNVMYYTDVDKVHESKYHRKSHFLLATNKIDLEWKFQQFIDPEYTKLAYVPSHKVFQI